MLCELDCTNTPRFSRPNVPAPLWHSRQSVNTTGRRSSFELVDPCGRWQASHPSTRTLACSKTNGPRLSTWHFKHGSSLSIAGCSIAELEALRVVIEVPPDRASKVPCGLWQSVHCTTPS